MDECKHCTYRGDFKTCSDAECSRHDGWYAGQLRERIAELESIEEGYENIKSIVKALEQEAEDREGHISTLQDEIAELEKAVEQLKGEEREKILDELLPGPKE